MSKAQSDGLRRAWANPKRKKKWLASLQKMWTPARRKQHAERLRKSWKRLGKKRAAGCKQRHEQGIRNALLKQGYTVLKGGWPDFICLKGRRIRFIEAKKPTQKVAAKQQQVHKILARFGIVVEIVRPKHTKEY